MIHKSRTRKIRKEISMFPLTFFSVNKVNVMAAGHLVTKQTDVLPQDLMKSRSREIRV